MAKKYLKTNVSDLHFDSGIVAGDGITYDSSTGIIKLNRAKNLYSNASVSASIETGTSFTKLITVTVPAGRYIVEYGALFSTNGNGYRVVCITKADSAPDNYPRVYVERVNAISGILTSISKSALFVLSEQTTLYLWGAQNSGSTLTVYPYIQALEI